MNDVLCIHIRYYLHVVCKNYHAADTHTTHLSVCTNIQIHHKLLCGKSGTVQSTFYLDYSMKISELKPHTDLMNKISRLHWHYVQTHIQ